MSLIINEIDVGPNPLLNNTHLYRVYYDQRSALNRDPITGVIDTVTSKFIIYYHQYYRDTNGDIDLNTFQNMTYEIMDVPGFPNLTNRLNQLWRTPINPAAPGIGDAVEAVLAALPFNVPNGYTLNTP